MHDALFWVHMGLALVLVASIPFTKLRHMVYIPLNVIFKPRRKEGTLDKIENIDEAEILGVGQVEQFLPQPQCPHCFNTLKNEYRQLGGDFNVQHYTEYLAELNLPWEGASPNGNGIHGSVAYHDSCYLGRYNGIYRQPRKLMEFPQREVLPSTSPADPISTL